MNCLDNHKCGVLIVAGSMHHLLSAMSYLECLKGKATIKDITILCDGFLGRKFAPSKEVLRRIEDDYCRVNVLNFEDGISSPSSVVNLDVDDFLYITPRGFSFRLYKLWQSAVARGTGFYWVDSEEGLGSYAGFFDRISPYLKGGNFGSVSKAIFNFISGSFFKREKLRCLTPDGELDIDSIYLKNLRSIYRRYYSREKFLKELSAAEPILLYASQPVVEMGWMGDAEYFTFLKMMKVKAKEMGYKFMVRPHPSERWEKYSDFLVYHSGSTIEEIVINDDCVKAISTICSTAIYTAKIIKNLDCFIIVNKSLEKRFYIKNSGCFRVLKNVADRFIVLD